LRRKDAVSKGTSNIAIGGDGQRPSAANEALGKNPRAAARDRGAYAGGHGEISAAAEVPCIDAGAERAGDIAVGGDVQGAGTVILGINAENPTGDGSTGPRGHAEIACGMKEGTTALRKDADIVGARDIAIGGDAERAAAVVEGIHAALPPEDCGASARHYGEIACGVKA
jgi:hypothetical protein